MSTARVTLATGGHGVHVGAGTRVRARLDTIALGGILVIAAGLRLWELDDTGQNLFYAASVRSMLDSWHNFFYVSFDPGGSLAVDKPPLGLWLEAASARVFGFHYWALALPQVFAGAGAAWVLFAFVRRAAGRWIATLSALFLAITPASVVTSRNNTFDTVTMLLTLLAAWSLYASVRSGQLRWLLLSAALLGLSFNTKMAEALLPLPAFTVYWITGNRLGRVRAAKRAAAFGAVLTLVSLSWIAAVGITPSSERPVIYNGEGNSIWALTFRYNGIDRVLGRQPQERLRGQTGVATTKLLAASLPPARGPMRLLTSRLANEIGWFVPLAAVGLVVVVRRRCREPEDVLWSAWFVSGAAYFSMAQVALPQYLEAITPPLAVLAAIGVTELKRLLGTRPLTAVGVCAVASSYSAWLLLRNPGEQHLAVGFLIVGLFAVALSTLPRWRARPGAVGAGGLLAVAVAGPFAWSLVTVASPATGSASRYPVSGPLAVRAYAEAAGGDQPTSKHEDPALRFLLANTSGMRYLVLTERALFGNGARYIVQANRPVLTLDSFGGDETEATATISRLVASGHLRYAELPSGGPWVDPLHPLGAWFTTHCTGLSSAGVVPLGDESQLYDCRP